MKKLMKKIKFEGIDNWNRPVFKAKDSRERFGCIHELFDYDATEMDVLSKVNEEDLCYFGNSFNCEPMGTNPGKHIEIAPILNPNFWDCECESNYIHAKTQKSCKFCGAIRDEQPDSRQAEILARTN